MTLKCGAEEGGVEGPRRRCPRRKAVRCDGKTRKNVTTRVPDMAPPPSVEPIDFYGVSGAQWPKEPATISTANAVRAVDPPGPSVCRSEKRSSAGSPHAVRHARADECFRPTEQHRGGGNEVERDHTGQPALRERAKTSAAHRTCPPRARACIVQHITYDSLDRGSSSSRWRRQSVFRMSSSSALHLLRQRRPRRRPRRCRRRCRSMTFRPPSMLLAAHAD